MLGEKRSEVVDGFRGVAVLSVMLFHYFSEWSLPLGYAGAFPGGWRVGKLGVDLFFVISGFVITMTTLRSRNALDFALKRAARLYPAFLAASFLIVAILAVADPLKIQVSAADLFANLTMMAGEIGFKYVDGVFWTLAVEVKFYAFVAIALLVLGRRFWIGLLVLAGLAVITGFFSEKLADHIFIARYLGFFLVGAASWYGLVEHNRRAALGLAVGAAAVLAFRLSDTVASGTPAWASYLYLATTIGALLLMLRFAASTPFGPLAWVGRISYSLYLVHQKLGVTLIALLIGAGVAYPFAIATTIAGALVLAWLLFKFVEIPGQKLFMSACSRLALRPAAAAARS